MSQKAEDLYDSDVDLEEVLDAAECNASGHLEENFVQWLVEKFEAYGLRMFLSDRQHEILERIANGESSCG